MIPLMNQNQMIMVQERFYFRIRKAFLKDIDTEYSNKFIHFFKRMVLL
jgi:hypothetical protein